MKRFLPTALLLVLPGCAPAQSSPAQAPKPASFAHADTSKIAPALDSLAHNFHGILGYDIENLDTGERWSYRGDETFPTASLIKVGILVQLFDLVEHGKISLSDPLTLLDIDKEPGSGVLQFMHNGLTPSVGDAARLMIILSDNTATNLILDRTDIRPMWDKMESLGLHHTKVHSKTFLRSTSVAMDSSAKYGLGVSTPDEMARLFTLIAEGKAVSPKADSAMLAILADNADMDSMQRHVDGLTVPHKTGATDSVRTECALFPLQSRVVACGFTKQNADTRWVVDNEAQVALGRIGLAVISAWPRK